MDENEKIEFKKLANKFSLREGLANSLFYGVLLGVILLVGLKYKIVGKIGFWIYVIFATLNTVRLVFITIVEVIKIIAPKRMVENEPTLKRAILLQTIEGILTLIYTFILYKVFIN